MGLEVAYMLNVTILFSVMISTIVCSHGLKSDAVYTKQISTSSRKISFVKIEFFSSLVETHCSFSLVYPRNLTWL